MSLNRVNENYVLDKINACYNQNSQSRGGACENFAGNLKEKAENKETKETAQQSAPENKGTLQVDYRLGKLASELLLLKSGRVEMHAYLETSVRHISYSESDHVKVCVQAGYTLKAQVKMEEHKVYIEQKNEDGTYQAYEVNPLKVSENTEDPIEQMALEAWEIARESCNNGMFTEIGEGRIPGALEEKDSSEKAEDVTFAEMVEQFEAFVEKRIKEGPPKIQIGSAEFTEDEWKRLLKRLDKDIDAYKEELRERVRRQKEKEARNAKIRQTENETEV